MLEASDFGSHLIPSPPAEAGQIRPARDSPADAGETFSGRALRAPHRQGVGSWIPRPGPPRLAGGTGRPDDPPAVLHDREHGLIPLFHDAELHQARPISCSGAFAVVPSMKNIWANPSSGTPQAFARGLRASDVRRLAGDSDMPFHLKDHRGRTEIIDTIGRLPR